MNYLYDTADGDLDRHFCEIGGETYRVLDKKFVDTIFDTLFPLCGNFYSHILEAVLTGSLGPVNSSDLIEISNAAIIDYDEKPVVLDEFL